MRPQIGQVLYIQIDAEHEDNKATTYKSRITDLADHEMAIEVPMEETSGRYKTLSAGVKVQAHFFTDGGVRNEFSATVKRLGKDVVPQIILEKPRIQAIKKNQKRHFLRVPARLEVALQHADTRFLAYTDDISGGGISFVYDARYPLGPHMELSGWLLIPFKHEAAAHVKFAGAIIRVGEHGNRQIAMMKFTEIQDRERDTIVRYCLERQLELKRK